MQELEFSRQQFVASIDDGPKDSRDDLDTLTIQRGKSVISKFVHDKNNVVVGGTSRGPKHWFVLSIRCRASGTRKRPTDVACARPAKAPLCQRNCRDWRDRSKSRCSERESLSFLRPCLRIWFGHYDTKPRAENLNQHEKDNIKTPFDFNWKDLTHSILPIDDKQLS